MKTQTFFQHKPIYNQCESSSSFSWLSWRQLRSSTPVRRNLSALPIVRALRVQLAGLRVASSNIRLYVGAWLILVVSPLAAIGYHLFDRHTITDPSGFYGNAFYTFYVLCPHIALLLSLTGVFFLFPEFSKRKYFLLAPATYHLSKILWLLQVESNNEFHQLVPMSFILLGLLAALIWLLTSDWLMSLHYHKREGIIARILGIINTPGVSDHDKVEIAKNEIRNLKQLS